MSSGVETSRNPFDLFARPLITHRRVFAGVGQNLGAVGRDGDVAHFQKVQLASHRQHLPQGCRQKLLVLAAETADRVVIRMGVAAEKTHRDIGVGRLLDGAGTERARGVAVAEHTQHHPWRVLLVARASLIHLEVGQRQAVHRIDNEVGQVVCGNPLAQVGGQQQGRIAVNIDESGWQGPSIRLAWTHSRGNCRNREKMWF